MILLIIGQFHVLQFFWGWWGRVQKHNLCVAGYFLLVCQLNPLHIIPQHTASAWFEPKKSFQKVYTQYWNVISLKPLCCVGATCRVHKKTAWSWDFTWNTPTAMPCAKSFRLFSWENPIYDSFFPLIDSGVKLHSTAFRWISRWPTQ